MKRLLLSSGISSIVILSEWLGVAVFGLATRYAVRKPLRMEISSSSFDAKRTEIVLEELLPVIMSAAKVPSGP